MFIILLTSRSSSCYLIYVELHCLSNILYDINSEKNHTHCRNISQTQSKYRRKKLVFDLASANTATDSHDFIDILLKVMLTQKLHTYNTTSYFIEVHVQC
jgi:hypothetical protein